MDDLKILARSKFAPIAAFPGDMVTCDYTDENGDRRELVRHEITESYVFEEAVVIEGTFEGRRSIGGLFVEGR